jgi:hypothetical protein
MNRPKGCMRGPFANAHGPEFYHHEGTILDLGYHGNKFGRPSLGLTRTFFRIWLIEDCLI